MKSAYLSNSIKAAVVVTALSCGANLRAVTITSAAQPLSGVEAGQSSFEAVDFHNSEEAKSLHKAYHLLAMGDHDYAGHRVEAMHHIEKAAALLGEDLSGDLADHTQQALSDDRMKLARRWLKQVLRSTEVKNQPQVMEQVTHAIEEINAGLAAK